MTPFPDSAFSYADEGGGRCTKFYVNSQCKGRNARAPEDDCRRFLQKYRLT